MCASWIGKHAEAFTLCRGLLARPDIPDPDRQRIAANRDFSLPAMLEAQLAQLRAQVHGRFWLHLGAGWRFFAPENYITRLSAVLDAEPQVFQLGINFTDAAKLSGACAAEQAVHRAPDAGRYLLTGAMASGPAMFGTPYARTEPSVCRTAAPIRSPNVGDRPPAPGCVPPASTKCSASRVCTARSSEVFAPTCGTCHRWAVEVGGSGWDAIGVMRNVAILLEKVEEPL